MSSSGQMRRAPAQRCPAAMGIDRAVSRRDGHQSHRVDNGAPPRVHRRVRVGPVGRLCHRLPFRGTVGGIIRRHERVQVLSPLPPLRAASATRARRARPSGSPGLRFHSGCRARSISAAGTARGGSIPGPTFASPRRLHREHHQVNRVGFRQLLGATSWLRSPTSGVCGWRGRVLRDVSSES